MWRNNVLGVRKCSSAAAWRNTRRYSSQTSLPITNEEFEEALSGVGRLLDSSQRYSPGANPWKLDTVDHPARVGLTECRPRLGFAISGGVDSMALASLFANTRGSKEFPNDLLAHAFIVDHKVRPESTEEAEWVAEQCRVKFGMRASVLPLTWPADFDPLDHKRFETDARTLRYQALGRACRAADIHDLLVAHHADDQAETVLMRLANNRLRSGLQAMQPVEWIPECSGIHGVSHSGTLADHRRHVPFPVEDGGVRILRPLLNFNKSRLVATCEQHGVAWVEDKTNHLQTYTSRNAIRHVLKNHKLPAALSIESLVDVSVHMQERVNWHKSQANRLLRHCPKKLDLQVGSLRIGFPSFQQLLERALERPSLDELPERPLERAPQRVNKSIATLTQSDWNRAKNVAICLLARAGQLVSPRENPPLGALASTVANIWPEFRESEKTDSSQAEFAGNRTSYCVHGIWWRKWNEPSPYFTGPYWLLTRQPLENHRPGATSRSIYYPPSDVLPLTQVLPGTSVSKRDDDYQFFDGRWWISIRNHSADALILRHFTKEDLGKMAPLQVARQGDPERFVAVALSMLKPADVRFTLPALFRRDLATKKETLVGFPTLDVSIGQLGCPEDVCSWQVRYKKLNNEITARSFSVLPHCVPGVMHQTIRAELAKFDKTPKRVARKNGRRTPDKGIASWNTKRTLISGDDKKAISPNFKRQTASKENTIPLVPITESERRGRSEKREGGGYNIKWEDFKDRFN